MGWLLAVVIALTAVALTTAACGGDDDSMTPDGLTPSSTTGPAGPDTSTPSNVSPGVALAMSQAPRATPSVSEPDVLSAADSMRALGVDLYGVLREQSGDGNLVFSPASIVTALAMTYAGAAGITAEEMQQALHFTLQDDTLHQAFNALDARLESRSWEDTDHKGDDIGVLVRSANSLWGQQDLAFEQPFLDTLATNYGAGVRLVDFETAAEAARVAIDAWVAEETADKIPELIPGGLINALTRLVLVNAVYLDATWASQFDPQLTEDGRFTTLSGDTVTVPMMHQSASLRYGEGDGWQAVDLPYLRDELSMLLIVPDQGRFAEVEARLAPDASSTAGEAAFLDEALANLTGDPEVQLALPKFEFRTQAGLRQALTALGMPSAFAEDAADFSRMTTQEALLIDEVIHEAYIAVDEEGTEAAAATAVVMRATGAPMKTVQLTIDRPFLFALRDVETGALLFLGRVTDPSA